MNFRQMQLVLAVAHFKSFTKAANELKIPQPSLSQSIKGLEKELKAPIFNRHTTPVTLTKEGEIFISKAKLIDEILDDLTNEITEASGIKGGKIRIGISQNGFHMIPDAIAKFCKKFKTADIKLTQPYSTLSIRKMILNDEIDIGMLILPINTHDLDYDVVKTEKTLLALPIFHPLSQKFKNVEIPKISINDVKNEKFILPKPDQRSRKGFDEIFKKAGFIPKVLCETEIFDIANAIVASGIGACFTIPQLIKEDKIDKIKLFDIGEKSLEKTLVIAYKKGKNISKIASEFIKLAKE